MAKSKHRKNHKQKLNMRKTAIKNQTNSLKKYESELMKRINEEAKSGSFDNVAVVQNEVENNDIIL